jgi:hypothetical protein
MSTFQKLWLKVSNEVLVLSGVAIAGLNAATVKTWQGYASAALVAVMRFVVTGPLTPIIKPPTPPA